MRLAVFLVLLLPLPAFAHGIADVSGRVLDAEGKPAANVRVAKRFTASLGSLSSANQTRTDAQGRFTLRVHLHAGVSHALMAVGVDESLGGIAAVSTEDLTGVELRLQPLYPLRGEVLAVDLGGPRTASVEVAALPSGAVIAQSSGRLGRFSLSLPAGRYRLIGRGSVDHATWQEDVTLGPDGLDVGEILLEGAPHTKLLGLVPPAWTVGSARSVDLPAARPPTSLREEDFAGRWLVVGFVDVRGPEGLTVVRLMVEFWQQQAAHRDRLAMVAFHAPWAKDFEQIRAKAGKLKLPFPELLDSSGKTYAAWEIGESSRILLLDPEGRLQRWDPVLLTERLSR